VQLLDAFEEGLQPELGLELPPEIEPVLAEALRAARLRWPDIQLDDTVFAEAVGRRCQPPTVETLERMALEDLFLAVACLHGDRVAVQTVRETLLLPIVTTALGTIGDREEHLQALLVNLVIGGPRSGPKLESYQARGSLRAWLRIGVIRTAKNARRTLARQPAWEDIAEELLPAPSGVSPERTEIRRADWRAFNEALTAALEKLDSGERRILRQHHLQGLTLEQMAAVYGIHRVTMARRLARARRQVMADVRQQLAARLDAPSSEVGRLIATVERRAEISFDRLLASRDEL
jgi:RNA polymerase sigma-70 factor (ECF subfamily)